MLWPLYLQGNSNWIVGWIAFGTGLDVVAN
jgi:hypothetical protein